MQHTDTIPNAQLPSQPASWRSLVPYGQLARTQHHIRRKALRFSALPETKTTRSFRSTMRMRPEKISNSQAGATLDVASSPGHHIPAALSDRAIDRLQACIPLRTGKQASNMA